MSCCCNTNSCAGYIECPSCHDAQEWSLTSTTPDSITHLDPLIDIVPLGESSIAHYTSEMPTHSCPDDPFVRVDSQTRNTFGDSSTNGGSVNTSNPWTPATPGNADGQPDSTKLVMWSGGSIHNGFKNPYDSYGSPATTNYYSGSYYFPHKSLADAIDGTHFTKTMTATFATEHFGTPNTTAPKLWYVDNTAGKIKYDRYVPLGSIDSSHNGRYQGVQQDYTKHIPTLYSWLGSGLNPLPFDPKKFNNSYMTGNFSQIRFDPWIEVSVFCLACPADIKKVSGTNNLDRITFSTNYSVFSGDTYSDSDGNVNDTYSELDQAEANRKVYLGIRQRSDIDFTGVAPSLTTGYMAEAHRFNQYYAFDTGATVADIDSGHGVEISVTSTNVIYDGGAPLFDDCNFRVDYDVTVSIPTISYSRTFSLQRVIPRCGLATSGVLNQSLHFVEAATMWNTCRFGRVGYDPDTVPANIQTALEDDTVVTSEDVSTWTGWLNNELDADDVADQWEYYDGPFGTSARRIGNGSFNINDAKVTGYINRITGIDVGGTFTDGAVFGADKLEYFYNSGATDSQIAADYNQTFIPNNTTWDVTLEGNFENAVAGDTLELTFDNFGRDAAEITSVTFDGDIFSSVDKTTDIVDPFEKVTFTFTVKSFTGTQEDTITIIHDSNGNQAPSPYVITIRMANTSGVSGIGSNFQGGVNTDACGGSQKDYFDFASFSKTNNGDYVMSFFATNSDGDDGTLEDDGSQTDLNNDGFNIQGSKLESGPSSSDNELGSLSYEYTSGASTTVPGSRVHTESLVSGHVDYWTKCSAIIEQNGMVYVGQDTARATNSSTTSVTVTPTPSEDDEMILHATCLESSTITTPSGWTLLGSIVSDVTGSGCAAANRPRSYLFHRTATASEGSVTITASGTAAYPQARVVWIEPGLGGP